MPQRRDELLPTRATLIRRLKDWQDHSSWQEFFDIYWRLIYSVARKAELTDAEAQDVVQETMVSVAKHMPGFKYDPALGSFKAWLLNMARWRITDQFRRRGRLVQPYRENSDARTNAQEKLVDPASQTLEDLWESEWKTNLLNAALARVKARVGPQKFQVFDFYVNKDWPPQKVAKQFGVSVNQVYVIKHRIAEIIRAEVVRLEKEMT